MSFCLSPRLGAIVALTAFFAFGAGAREANAAQAGGGGGTQDFNFSFSASLGGGGSISGSGVLVAEPDSMAAPGAWLVTNVTGGTLNYVPPAPVLQPLLAQDPTYSLTWAPPGAYLSNDNLLFPNSNPQLDDNGISFNVGNGAGYLNISDPPMTYNFNLDLSVSGGGISFGSGNFQATPGPTPGTGLLAFALLILAGAAARARGLLAP